MLDPSHHCNFHSIPPPPHQASESNNTQKNTNTKWLAFPLALLSVPGGTYSNLVPVLTFVVTDPIQLTRATRSGPFHLLILSTLLADSSVLCRFGRQRSNRVFSSPCQAKSPTTCLAGLCATWLGTLRVVEGGVTQIVERSRGSSIPSYGNISCHTSSADFWKILKKRMREGQRQTARTRVVDMEDDRDVCIRRLAQSAKNLFVLSDRKPLSTSLQKPLTSPKLTFDQFSYFLHSNQESTCSSPMCLSLFSPCSQPSSRAALSMTRMRKT